MSKVLHPNETEFNTIIKEGTVLVDFYADWCGPCKMLAPVLEQLADAYDGKVKVVKVNVDQEQALAMKYRVSSIPALFVLKNEEIVEKEVGYRPYPLLEQMIQSHL